VLVPMSMEATLSGEVGSDFTAEFLRNDVRCQFGLEDFEGGPVVEVITLERGSGDDPYEKLIMGLARDGVDGKVETVQILLKIIF